MSDLIEKSHGIRCPHRTPLLSILVLSGLGENPELKKTILPKASAVLDVIKTIRNFSC